MKSDKDCRKKGLGSEIATAAEDALTTEERSFDIGKSGQFAPGGYYNQQGINAPDRRSLDDDIVPPARQ